jgi:hypothetical protein
MCEYLHAKKNKKNLLYSAARVCVCVCVCVQLCV